jgi:hypothetical protein
VIPQNNIEKVIDEDRLEGVKWILVCLKAKVCA